GNKVSYRSGIDKAGEAMVAQDKKVIIVEGRTDKVKVERLIREEVDIVCTNGTIGIDRIEDMIEAFQMDDRDVYILVDEDKAGKKLHKQLSFEIPHARHIYIDKAFREVAATPEPELASVLAASRIHIYPYYL